MKAVCSMAVWLAALACIARAATVQGSFSFTGAMDCSAALGLGADRFLAASDEDNTLRLYQAGRPGAAVGMWDLNRLVLHRRKGPEFDLEGAAALGEHLFWIGSHGRKADGQPAPHRRVLFALRRQGGAETLELQPFGRVYTNLVADMAQDQRFHAFGLAKAAELPPESPGGLNIEAMAATAQGGLLIGFRNPIPGGRALIVPLLNPVELVSGRPPVFGDPILLDLGGLGLRDALWTGEGYYLIAGPARGRAGTGLFFWKGGDAKPQPVSGVRFAGLNPEALAWIEVQGRRLLLVLSDDGGRQAQRAGTKRAGNASGHFRGLFVLP